MSKLSIGKIDKTYATGAKKHVHVTSRTIITVRTSPAPRNAPAKISCKRSQKTNKLKIGNACPTKKPNAPLVSKYVRTTDARTRKFPKLQRPLLLQSILF